MSDPRRFTVLAVGVLITAAVALAATAPASAPASASTSAPTSAPDDPVPPRTASGQALAVPEEQLDRGDVYHVTPGADTQIAVRCDAPLMRAVVTCDRVVGYVLAPFDLTDDAPPLLAGALRIPVASLKSGVPAFDEQLHSPPTLNQAQYSEITVYLTRVMDAKLEKSEGNRRAYTLKATADVRVKGKTVSLEMPLHVLAVPFTWATMMRSMGDLLIVRGTLELDVADLGFDAPSPRQADFLPATLRIDVSLTCSTSPPEKNLDPAVTDEEYVAQLQFVTLLHDFDDPERAYAFGRELMGRMAGHAALLDRLASVVLDEPGVTRRDLRFALENARRAVTLTGEHDAGCLHTLARVLYEQGDLAAAAERAGQAAACAPPNKPEAAVLAALAQRYAAEAEQAAKTGEVDKAKP